MENSKKPIGIWVRVSTEDQAKGESLEHHEHRAKMYAEVKGWEVKEVYRLGGVSGKAVIDHPEARRMMRDVKSGHISGLIFSKLARLARSTKQLLEFADFFQAYDADLISLQESIDTSTPAGRLFYTIIAAMAQWEREEIANRVKASIPVRAKLGKHLGGQTPYGYQWTNDKLEINPQEAPVRKLMFELYLEHKRYKQVIRILNERGYRTRKGRKFAINTIKRLLTDPVAKGLRRTNYTDSQGPGKFWKLKPEEDWVFQKVPAIVSEELWDKVNAIIEAQTFKRTNPSRGVVHLFAGYTYCTCGTKMYARSRSPKYVCTKCKIKIEIQDLEDIFREQLRTFIIDSDQVAAHLNTTHEAIASKEVLLDNLEQEVIALNEKLSGLIELFQKGQLPQEGFGKHYQPIFDQLKQTEQRIPELKGEIDFLKIQLLSSDQILSEAHSLYERWPEMPFKSKRSIIEAILQKIIIGEDEIEIFLHHLPTIKDIDSTTSPTTLPETNVDFTSHSSELIPKGFRNLFKEVFAHQRGCGKSSLKRTGHAGFRRCESQKQQAFH